MTDQSVAALRAALDGALVGQDDAKVGLLLGLLAREHVYLEGPPGCGKSQLAEAFAQAVGAHSAAIQFHRDTRCSDLLGDPILHRYAIGQCERLSRRFQRGPILRAEVVILDDLSRAPGEALGPLLRILEERRVGGVPLPLETAIATGAPPRLESHLDPLEPNQLDRFAIQIRLRGLVGGRSWVAARQALDAPPSAALAGVLDRTARHKLQRDAARLAVHQPLRHALLGVVQRLRTARVDGQTGLITDRAFSRMALRVLRAHALLRGALRVENEDMIALRYMLACRVPEPVLRGLGTIIEEVLAEEQPRTPVSVGARVTQRLGETSEARTDQRAQAPEPSIHEVIEEGDRQPDAVPTYAADVDRLLRALEGRIQKGRVESADDPGGQPRRYRRMERLDELFDADTLETLLYVDGKLADSPRTFKRERRTVGGTLAVLRDVSASMEGTLSRWAGEVVTGLFRRGARHRMRIGYIEFNHDAVPFRVGGSLFHRRYSTLFALGATHRAEGRTNYQAPLREALGEFRGRIGRDRHVVMLTDGRPILGDPTVVGERSLARKLGVRIHTVFLGTGECPAILDQISRETDGVRFRAHPGRDGRLRVEERTSR